MAIFAMFPTRSMRRFSTSKQPKNVSNGTSDFAAASRKIAMKWPHAGSSTRKHHLDILGIEQLEAYLQDLEAEAEQVKEKIAAKKSYLASVDSLFKA